MDVSLLPHTLHFQNTNQISNGYPYCESDSQGYSTRDGLVLPRRILCATYVIAPCPINRVTGIFDGLVWGRWPKRDGTYTERIKLRPKKEKVNSFKIGNFDVLFSL
jgi:hypothetical protein